MEFSAKLQIAKALLRYKELGQSRADSRASSDVRGGFPFFADLLQDIAWP